MRLGSHSLGAAETCFKSFAPFETDSEGMPMIVIDTGVLKTSTSLHFKKSVTGTFTTTTSRGRLLAQTRPSGSCYKDVLSLFTQYFYAILYHKHFLISTCAHDSRW